MSKSKNKSILIFGILMLAVLAILVGLCACNNNNNSKKAENPTIRISTTTSVNDSGLLPYLQPSFEEETGYKMEVTSAGTGAAIKKGESGDADVLLVHAKASEEEFINKGYGEKRISFMYNYFVIVGPSDDPAGVAKCKTAADAFKAISASGQKFVSRGDDSGTNKKELEI